MPFKIALLADGSVGERIVRWLLETHLQDIQVVVCVSDNDLAETVRSHGVPVLIAKTNDEVHEALTRFPNVDLGFLLWWPYLVKRNVLMLTKNGFINTHPSLLPHGRGKHYNFWTIVEEAPFGVSLHFVEEGIDCGDIVAQRSINYSWEDTGKTLYEKAQSMMFELFVHEYPSIKVGNIRRNPQDLTLGSLHYARELEPASLIELDRSYTGRELLNLLRARTFNPYPACRFIDEGQTFEVRVLIERKS